MKMIVAMTPSGLIGSGSLTPWNFPPDLRRFRRLTRNSTLIVGRKTYESMTSSGFRPVERHVVVVSKSKFPPPTANVKYAPSIYHAVEMAGSFSPVWICGGAQIYSEFLINSPSSIVEIDVVQVPEVIPVPPSPVYFPLQSLHDNFHLKSSLPFEDCPDLLNRVWIQKGTL